MPTELHILGIRHHGPGSARLVTRAIEQLRPEAVLIEGPADAAELLPFVGREELRPPVALLLYEPDEPQHASYYPFAVFSPEWQAMRLALQAKAELRLIDLPFALQRRHEASEGNAKSADGPGDSAAGGKEETSETGGTAEKLDSTTSLAPESTAYQDPLDALARSAGYSDGEAWWGRLIEEHRGEQDPLAAFAQIHDAMAAARTTLGDRPGDTLTPVREAHMRKALRATIKQGFGRIVVVCGAWHAPVLTGQALAEIPAKQDDALLKQWQSDLPKRKAACTWIPWTNDRLASASGYSAGINSPGWYEHLWLTDQHHESRWLTKVARLMRDESLDAAPAGVIEATRLAEALAAMRGRSAVGLDELDEATLAVLCHGNPLPMAVISRKLAIGSALGTVPSDVPSVPLQRDLADQQRALRLKVSADDIELDLDLRKPNDLARSQLLHRLCLLGVPWGSLQADQRQRASTFHEVWTLRWNPELSILIIEAARWGNTVHAAASALARDRAAKATEMPALATLLGHALQADLPDVVAPLIDRIATLAAVASDLSHLLDAIPPLARLLRYGDVRGTDRGLILPVVEGLLTRAGIALLPGCAALDDEAAREMRARIDAVDGALTTLALAPLLQLWRDQLRRLADCQFHGVLIGRCWRLLLDAGAVSVEEAGNRLALELSPGAAPANSAHYLDGFLAGTGAILIHDDRLLRLVDTWVCSLPGPIFEASCPVARRTFATFSAPERRTIGEKIKSSAAPGTAGSALATAGGREREAAPGSELEPGRAALVDPVLLLILGEPLP